MQGTTFPSMWFFPSSPIGTARAWRSGKMVGSGGAIRFPTRSSSSHSPVHAGCGGDFQFSLNRFTVQGMVV
jgi:hypothetical protein